MTAIADEQRRVTLPEQVSPGEVFDLEEAGCGGFLLKRAERLARPIRLERRNGYLVAVTDHVITQAATRRAFDALGDIG